MRLGILYAGFNNFKYAKLSILPWITLKYMYPQNFFISAVSVPFLEYKNENINPDETTDFLKTLSKAKFIDSCFDEPKYIKENEPQMKYVFMIEPFVYKWMYINPFDRREELNSVIFRERLNGWIDAFFEYGIDLIIPYLDRTLLQKI